jgi:uncharacterized protein (TIGR03000 family)
MTFKRSLLAALLAVSAVGMMTESSNAFFGRWRGGSCGSSGGWGSRGSWGSHGGGWGSHGGGWGSHGGSWGGYGSGGSWGGSYGGYGGGYYGGYARSGAVYDRVIVRSARPVERTIAAAPAVKTRLTLNVPAEAKVTLAGVATKQSGEVRQYSTTKLAAGQVWDDYKVVVELDRNGETLREERMLKLTGGRPQELTVNFDSNQLAQR